MNRAKALLHLLTVIFVVCAPPGLSAAPTTADIIANYEAIGAAIFGDAASAAQALDKAVDDLLARPSAETLGAARDAWKKWSL